MSDPPIPLSPSPESGLGTSSKLQPQNESDIDKFANLFNPQTPPASPTLPPIFSPPKPTSSIRSGSFHHRQTHSVHESIGTPSSTDSEFGSFVSVPPAQDPLSELFFPASPSVFSPVSSYKPARDVAITGLASSSSPHSAQFPIPNPPYSQKHVQNPSRVFFGQFTEDAKARGEQRREYLDELLRHEDDPLYWVKSEGEGSQNTERSPRQAETGPGHQHGGQEMIGWASVDGVTDGLEESPLDLDLDPNSRSGASSDLRAFQRSAPAHQLHSAKPFSTPPLSPAFPASRSPPQLHSPPRPTSTEPTSSMFSSTPQIVRSSSSSSVPLLTSLPSSSPSSYNNSLSSLSSRWMSSLISTSRPSAPSTSGDDPSTLHSIFASKSTSSDELPHPTQRPQPQHPKTQNSLPASPHSTAIAILKPHQSHPLPIAPPSFSSTSTGSLFIPSTAASSAISHGTPFASRSFVPPSGAPGFVGDHAWDKGFSNDFDKEKVEGRSIRLEGRKGMTSVVLEMALASLIRAHLPALARLPRTWNLLYSLDQHGISLNTLYTRCEPQGSTASRPTGTLIIVKDSADALFGAWLGEELKLSKGSYYGSGESFLWKYVNGKLKVFKWTGKNDYVALCEPEFLSLGGGDGHYGLYLDDTLLEGSSARCPTFENEPLCSSPANKGGTVPFECVGLEVWGIGPA